MILLIHGAFDFKHDPDSGIEQLAGELREVGLDVQTINANQELQSSPEIVVGYSNGADVALTRLMSSPYPVKLLVLLDPVWKNNFARFFRRPIKVPSCVKLCYTYLRKSGNTFPSNSRPDRDIIEMVDVGHGDIPVDRYIRNGVIQLIKGASNVDEKVLV